MKDILSEIVAHKREEINALKERMPVDKIYVNACYHPTASLRNALETSSHGIIAEFKRRSPSKGWIKRKAKPSDIIPGYRKSGAAALSVLTDEKYFGGTLPENIERDTDNELVKMINELRGKYEADMEKYAFQSALSGWSRRGIAYCRHAGRERMQAPRCRCARTET